MRIRGFVVLALVASSIVPVAGHADEVTSNEGVTVTVSDASIEIDNGLVRRRFTRTGLRTLAIEAFGEVRSGEADDVAFGAVRTPFGFNPPVPATIDVQAIPGGLALTRSIGLSDGSRIRTRLEMIAGVAGMRQQHWLDLTAPLALERYELDRVVAGDGTRATAHAFRAGADWRYDDGFDPVGIGDDHRGHWRSSLEGAVGEDLDAFGEWIEVAYPDGSTAAIVMERHDYASSRVEFRARNGRATAVVDLSRDLVYTGPFEEAIHVESPEETAEAGRVRVLAPGQAFGFEPVWTVFGRDTDETAAGVQALIAHRNRHFEREVVFNTNNVDENHISTGAKDDVDYATFVELARAAREAGVTTFVLDDGWQAISGDWCPDSPRCPEPRAGQDPVKFAPRFPDDTFEAVRAILADDPETPHDDRDLKLGLWMTPMEFHPASKAFTTNPQWACLPVGVATAGLSIVQPDSGSNEAGIGVWNPLAWGVNPESPSEPMRLDQWIESRIDRMVEVYGATYFKFDFLAFVDCGGAQPVDQYQYREAFIAMVDRLIAKHPEVLFTIDETNDYRMFPYESTARGATWFQNGSPRVSQALHNVWNLSPFVPGYALGQGIASRGDELGAIGVDALMATGLTSHLTIWRDLRAYSPAERAQLATWNAFYRAHADTLAQMTYPLLDDPLDGGWTALQPWNAAASTGWVLAYRQGDARDDVSIPVRALGQLDPATVFDVVTHDPATGASSATTMTAAELAAGLPVSAPVNGYELVRLSPAADQGCVTLPGTGC